MAAIIIIAAAAGGLEVNIERTKTEQLCIESTPKIMYRDKTQ